MAGRGRQCTRSRLAKLDGIHRYSASSKGERKLPRAGKRNSTIADTASVIATVTFNCPGRLCNTGAMDWLQPNTLVPMFGNPASRLSRSGVVAEYATQVRYAELWTIRNANSMGVWGGAASQASRGTSLCKWWVPAKDGRPRLRVWHGDHSRRLGNTLQRMCKKALIASSGSLEKRG